MMNQRGFGLLVMFGFCAFLGLCLCVSIYYYHELIKLPHYDNGDVEVHIQKCSYCMYNDYRAVNS